MSLMYACDNEPIQGRTRFQKMVFLLQEETEGHHRDLKHYRFKPYDYGPFSKELYDDLDELIERGLVSQSQEEFGDDKVFYEYELTEKGFSFMEESCEKEEIRNIVNVSRDLKSDLNHMELSEVLDYVYSEYTEYAENSVLR